MATDPHDLIIRIQHSMAALQTASLYGMVKTACFGVDKGEAILKEIDAVLREANTLQELRALLQDEVNYHTVFKDKK